jgi:hypothetical protein
MNGFIEAEAGLGSTGVGVGVGVAAAPNGNALLGGSAVVGVGRLNLNPPLALVLVAAGAGTSAFGASAGAGAAGGAPKAKLVVVLGASVAPITGNPNGFGPAAFDLSLSPDGGATAENDGTLIGAVAATARSESFTGDPLSISSSCDGGVLVFSGATVARVGCGLGLGAAVGAVNTIVGAGAESVIGAVWVLNSGAGLA